MNNSAQTKKIWQQMHDRLLSYIRRRVATEHDAEDILQDVFLRIHQNLQRLRDSESVTAWIYQIARNAIADYHRQRAKAARITAQLAEEAGETAGLAQGGGAEPEPMRRATEEFAQCLQPLLGQLPEHYQEAITLTELNGMTQKDAAGKLGLSVSGMKARVQRGRSKLKDVVLDCCNVELDRRGGLVDYERRNGPGCEDCPCT